MWHGNTLSGSCLERWHWFWKNPVPAVSKISSLSTFIPLSIILWNTLSSSAQSAQKQFHSLKSHMHIWDLFYLFSFVSSLLSLFFFFLVNSVGSVASLSIHPCFSAILPKWMNEWTVQHEKIAAWRRKNARFGSMGTRTVDCHGNLVRSGTFYPDKVFTRRRWSYRFRIVFKSFHFFYRLRIVFKSLRIRIVFV